jgi:prolyl-tRNA synthetase
VDDPGERRHIGDDAGSEERQDDRELRRAFDREVGPRASLEACADRGLELVGGFGIRRANRLRVRERGELRWRDILASTGESEVFCHKDYLSMDVPGEEVNFDDVSGLRTIVNKWTSQYAATSDMHDVAAYSKVPADSQVSARGIEVGHIFYFGTKYSEPMKATVAAPDGTNLPVHMGSYGIGPTRLVAAIIEASHDEAGIKWPESVAPFKVGILNLKQGDTATDAACEKLYSELNARGVDVLYDDTDERAGAKFASMDLIGLPWQVLVGPKGLADGKIELKRRSNGSRELVSPADVLVRLKQ